jgi:hypothetical protein
MLRKLKYRYIVMFIMRMYQYIGASKQPGSIKNSEMGLWLFEIC